MPVVSVVLHCVWGLELSWLQLRLVQGEITRTQPTPNQQTHILHSGAHIMMYMAVLAAVCLLLISPPRTLQSEQNDLHPPLAPPHVRQLHEVGESARLDVKQTYASLDKENAKVGLFIAASIGTFALMAAVYCIYTKFYPKQQYLHAQLNEDSDFLSDPPAIFFHSVGSSTAEVQRGGYGSLSDTPSIISVPPSLSPPPAAMPFPPHFVSSRSMRTISAKDLEKSCI
ncbi:uncharacterized protein isoform X1 [Takifugu rubripes]|uniref:Uncharacterized protein n=2 Tax=Takifugu TaxID=31032 RepID=A0A4Z2CIE9_9TELE|nr:uncharacterized protein LOC115251197 isoform X1 [Takifugu rubripes]TNN04013.1 hypothetical protein fugu_001042 [Takifugu bimaculatus]